MTFSKTLPKQAATLAIASALLAIVMTSAVQTSAQSLMAAPALAVAATPGPVMGFIAAAGFQTDAGGTYISGWACQQGVAASIAFHVYVGSVGTGVRILNGVANMTNEAAVDTACKTTGVNHRFKTYIPDTLLSQYKGQKLYVYGIHQQGSFPNAALTNSGTFVFPTPPADCHLVASSSAIIAGQSALLVWSTANTSSISINQGVGAVTPVLAGSISVSPQTTTKYTATARGNSTASCSTTIKVTQPTISLTAPANNATVSGNITVAATASDNTAVMGVQFKIDGRNIGSEDTAVPYTTLLNTGELSFGSHELVAVARDAAGTVASSTTRIITVANPMLTQKQTLWYEPSNGGTGGGYLPDFLNIFSVAYGDTWKVSRGYTDVLILRSNTIKILEAQYPGFIRNTLAPFFVRTGLKLGIDTGAATFASCRGPIVRNAKLQEELAVLRAISDAGTTISYINMQSTLSKGTGEDFDCAGASYTLAQRIDDIAWYMSSVKKALPSQPVEFGLIDASLVHLGNVAAVEEKYEPLLLRLKNEGLRLSFVHLDHPWDYFGGFNPNTGRLAEIKSFQTWLKNSGIASGIFMAANMRAGGSETLYNTRVLEVLKGMKSIGTNQQYVLASWFPLPTTELPESPANASRYPMTRILKNIGAYLKK